MRMVWCGYELYKIQRKNKWFGKKKKKKKKKVLCVDTTASSASSSSSSLSRVTTFLSPLDEKVIGSWKRKFPSVALHQSWGVTESTFTATLTTIPVSTCSTIAKTEEEGEGEIGTQFSWVSVGPLLPNTEAVFLDYYGDEVEGTEASGEICIKGPHVIQAYYNSPVLTKSLFRDNGFLKTGDKARIDADGVVWLRVAQNPEKE
eukprot:TRINITY_DN6668_c0_g1_i5.p1 TRINITY_DN6668_c0_g1~~TRINITY_DN6668_c0_g1_i5.p1  ORF type:complete len:203 (-),score=54.56 TRINITY_DN6668_c0_g1_i5:25-633(-)